MDNAPFILPAVPATPTEVQAENPAFLAARGMAAEAWEAATGVESRETFDTATATTEDLAQHLKALVNDLLALGILVTRSLT